MHKAKDYKAIHIRTSVIRARSSVSTCVKDVESNAGMILRTVDIFALRQSSRTKGTGEMVYRMKYKESATFIDGERPIEAADAPVTCRDVLHMTTFHVGLKMLPAELTCSILVKIRSDEEGRLSGLRCCRATVHDPRVQLLGE